MKGLFQCPPWARSFCPFRACGGTIHTLSAQPSLRIELGSLLAKLELEDVFRANTTQSLTGTYLLTLMNADRFQITVNRDVAP